MSTQYFATLALTGELLSCGAITPVDNLGALTDICYATLRWLLT